MNKLRMFLPPCPAAGFGAEFSLLTLWKRFKRFATMAADMHLRLCRYPSKLIAAAETFYRIL